MSGLRRLLRGARLLDPDSGRDMAGDVIVVDDRIAGIGHDIHGEGLGPDVEVVELGGLCLAPGLVDMRVQLREPGDEHIRSIESGSQAAAAGGVTTMVALPNTEPPVDNVPVVEFLARRAREVRLTKVHTYAAATKGLHGKELTEMGLLAENGALGFTDGVKAIADALVMRRVLAYARTFDQLVVQHPEEPSLGGAGEVTEGEVATRLGLAGIPPAAEAIMVERRLAPRRADRRALPCRACVDRGGDRRDPQGQGRWAAGHLRHRPALFRAQRDRDRRLPHLCQAVAAAARRERPPGGGRRARRRDDRCNRQRPRAVGSGFEAPALLLGELGALSGWRALLPLSLELYHNRHMTLLDVLRCLTAAPARILGLGVGFGWRPAHPPILWCSTPMPPIASRPTGSVPGNPRTRRSTAGRCRGAFELTIVDGRTIFFERAVA